MQFQLKVLNNGKEELWHYDNYTNIVTDADSVDRYAHLKSKEYLHRYPANGKDTRFKYGDSVLDFYIVLGLKCNFHCAYCRQTDVPKDLLEEASPKKVMRLVELMVNSGLTIEQNILLWGGEPLVYWKTIKLLVPELRKHYKSQKISIQTNGALLDDEKMEFFHKYDVSVGISYDGYHTMRDYPVFDDTRVFNAVKKALNKDYRIAILPLITNTSDHPSEIKRDLTCRFGHEISVGHYSIVKCTTDDSSFINVVEIDKEKREKLYTWYYENLHQPYEKIEPSLKERFNEVIAGLAQGIPVDSVRSSCCVHIGRGMCVDINGNILTCMNYPLSKYGHLSDYKNAVATDFYSYLNKKSCMACPYVNACFGVCPLIKDENSHAFKITCNNVKPYAKAMTEAAIDSLYGVRVLSFK